MLEAFQSKTIGDSLWRRQILIQVKTKEKQKSTSPPKCVGMRTTEGRVVFA